MTDPAARTTTGEQHRLAGLTAACRALASGQAVVVPNPSPMTYGLVATSASAVNAVKGRPVDQPVAVSLHDAVEWQRVMPALDLPGELLPRLRMLLCRRLSLLVPVRDTARLPAWVRSGMQDGYLAVFNGRWTPLDPLWNRFPRLHGSSANRTGEPPAACAADAARMLGADVPVIDGDALRDACRTHAASSMVRVTPDGKVRLHRRGAQGADSAIDSEADRPPEHRTPTRTEDP